MPTQPRLLVLVLAAAVTAGCVDDGGTAAPPNSGATASGTSTGDAAPTPAQSPSDRPTPADAPAPPSPDDDAADPADADGTEQVLVPTVDGPFDLDLLAATDPPAPVRFTVALRDPTTPGTLAATIVAGEEAVRDASLSDDARAVAAHRVQRAYRQLGRSVAWRDEVVAMLPARWRDTASGNLAARDALNRLLADGEPPTELPAWAVVAPEPVDDLLRHYRDAEAEIGADWEVLAAINLVETRMGRIVGLSTAGARGPMQFIPASWDAFGAGGDIDDARDSIFAAARHLTQRPGSPPSERNALFNYNNSPHYVDAVVAYADVLRADPDAYRSYHGWQVYYVTPRGEFLLPVGYREEEPVPVDEYLARPALEVIG